MKEEVLKQLTLEREREAQLDAVYKYVRYCGATAYILRIM
jgi:hypothetical protein